MKFLKALVSTRALVELQHEKALKEGTKYLKKLHEEQSLEIINALKNKQGMGEEEFKKFLIELVESKYMISTIKIQELSQEVNTETQKIIKKIDELYKSYSYRNYPQDIYFNLLEDLMHVARILLDDRNGPQTIAAKLIRNRKKIYDVEAKIWTAKNNNSVFELNALTSELNALTTNKISLMYEADLLKNSKVEAIEPHTIDPTVSNTAQVSLNDLKRKQQEIQRQIEIETAKLQQTNLSSPALNSNESDFDSIKNADKNNDVADIKQSIPSASEIKVSVHQYKGRTITREGAAWKVSSVIQQFESLHDAEIYVDQLESNQTNLNIAQNNSSNSGLDFFGIKFLMILSVIGAMVLFVSITNSNSTYKVNYKSLVGKGATTLFSTKGVINKIKSIGADDSLINYFLVAGPEGALKLDGEFLVGTGCMQHRCNTDEGLIIVNTKTDEVIIFKLFNDRENNPTYSSYGTIYNAQTNTFDKPLPPSAKKWMRSRNMKVK